MFNMLSVTSINVHFDVLIFTEPVRCQCYPTHIRFGQPDPEHEIPSTTHKITIKCTSKLMACSMSFAVDFHGPQRLTLSHFHHTTSFSPSNTVRSKPLQKEMLQSNWHIAIHFVEHIFQQRQILLITMTAGPSLLAPTSRQS